MTLLDVTLQIFRYKPGEHPHYDTFTVQVDDTAHLIDASIKHGLSQVLTLIGILTVAYGLWLTWAIIH